MKIGDPVRIYLHGHDQWADGTVCALLPDNFIKATINEGHGVVTIEGQDYDLSMHNGAPRVITFSPDMYELKGKRKK